jgi:2'-5' RNA ligase
VPTIVGPTLPDPHAGRVELLRADLVERFDVDPYANPFPQFTLYGLGDDADPTAVERAVERATADHAPVTVHTDGVGVFPGNHVWIPVARSPALTALQADVAPALATVGDAPTPYYEPHRWFPHVGLALGVDDDRAGDIVTFLLDDDVEWDFTVRNVTVTHIPSDGGDAEVVATVDL